MTSQKSGSRGGIFAMYHILTKGETFVVAVPQHLSGSNEIISEKRAPAIKKNEHLSVSVNDFRSTEVEFCHHSHNQKKGAIRDLNQLYHK
jgi:hypothetical protein